MIHQSQNVLAELAFLACTLKIKIINSFSSNIFLKIQYGHSQNVSQKNPIITHGPECIPNSMVMTKNDLPHFP